MTVESALYPPQLNTALPQASDMVSEGDNHIRLTKTVIKTTFPNVAGVVSATDIQLSYVTGVTSGIQGQIDGKGAITGQTWTGTHVFPSTTTIGSLTPTILGYLETVTSDAQAQINSKAAKAGDTYTGAHNFTGATVTVPTLSPGTTGNGAVSADLLNSTAFSAALPGQSGNAEKFTHTDGSAADWQFPVLLPVPVAVNTAMVAGRKYIATAAGITLTFPASMATRDPIEVMNASSGDISVDFNGHTVKNQTPDSPMLVPTLRGFQVTYTGSTLA